MIYSVGSRQLTDTVEINADTLTEEENNLIMMLFGLGCGNLDDIATARITVTFNRDRERTREEENADRIAKIDSMLGEPVKDNCEKRPKRNQENPLIARVLKPCPFCGRQANIHGNPCNHFYVGCDHCHIYTRVEDYDSIEIWNRRTDTPDTINLSADKGPVPTVKVVDGHLRIEEGKE